MTLTTAADARGVRRKARGALVVCQCRKRQIFAFVINDLFSLQQISVFVIEDLFSFPQIFQCQCQWHILTKIQNITKAKFWPSVFFFLLKIFSKWDVKSVNLFWLYLFETIGEEKISYWLSYIFVSVFVFIWMRRKRYDGYS